MSDVMKKAATPANPSSQSVERAEEPRQDHQIEILINGVRVEVSPELKAAVHRAYQGLLRPLPREMTTTQAAEFLDVSRPFVIKLIDRGELPCRKVGKHRRIPSDALVQYREKMFQRAKAAADEISQIAQDLGLHDLEGPPPETR